MNNKELVTAISQIIFEKKGMNILALDVKGISSISDYIIIAEGNVDRHLASIAKGIVEQLQKTSGEKPAFIDGMQSAEWIVIDYIDIVIHLFLPHLRERYAIERLWPKAKSMDLKLMCSSEGHYA